MKKSDIFTEEVKEYHKKQLGIFKSMTGEEYESHFMEMAKYDGSRLWNEHVEDHIYEAMSEGMDEMVVKELMLTTYEQAGMLVKVGKEDTAARWIRRAVEALGGYDPE